MESGSSVYEHLSDDILQAWDSASSPRGRMPCGDLVGAGSLVVNRLVTQHGYTPQSISFWRFVLAARGESRRKQYHP
jgi:hypothetical protein